MNITTLNPAQAATIATLFDDAGPSFVDHTTVTASPCCTMR